MASPNPLLSKFRQQKNTVSFTKKKHSFFYQKNTVSKSSPKSKGFFFLADK